MDSKITSNRSINHKLNTTEELGQELSTTMDNYYNTFLIALLALVPLFGIELIGKFMYKNNIFLICLLLSCILLSCFFWRFLHEKWRNNFAALTLAMIGLFFTFAVALLNSSDRILLNWNMDQYEQYTRIPYWLWLIWYLVLWTFSYFRYQYLQNTKISTIKTWTDLM